MELASKLAAAAIGIALSGGAVAAVYKWVDETGVTHYGEKPPSGAKARELDIRSTPPTPSAGSPGRARTAEELEREFQQRRVERLEGEKKEAELAKAKEVARSKCESAQRRLAGLTSGRRVIYSDRNGNSVPVVGEFKSSEIQRATEEIKTYC